MSFRKFIEEPDFYPRTLKERFLGGLLYSASFFYGLGVNFRNGVYTAGLFRIRKLPVPVISVGNLTVGGTGKTPLVAWIARYFLAQGLRPCILSRGYGRENEEEIILLKGGQDSYDYKKLGDEPALLARQLPGAIIALGAHRYRAAISALEKYSPDLFILDDGFQHRKLARDLNILLLDSDNPWGNGHLFPRGSLREPRKSLARADVIVLTKARENEDYSSWQQEIRKWNSQTSLLIIGYKSKSLWQIQSNAQISPDKLYDKNIMAFSGIARPQSFQSTLEALGAKVIKFKAYPDHHPYTSKDISQIIRAAEAAEVDFIVTTEKDAVRIRDMELPHPIWALGIEVELIEGKDSWETLLKNFPVKQK